MTTNTSPRQTAEPGLLAVARSADRVVVLFVCVAAAAALAIGQSYGDLGLALLVSALAVGLSAVTFVALRGTYASQVILTSCAVVMVALQIQLGRGTLEFHFGVFVLLGLLLVYRDWRPLLLAAGLFAVHHVAFDRMQALNIGVYCTPQADLLKMLMHALYVVLQTSVELYLAVALRQAAVDASELNALVAHIDRDGELCLDLSSVRATAPTAAVLKAAVAKIGAAMVDVRTAAESIGRAAAEVASGNLDLSRRTESQSSGLQQTATSMEELTGTVKNTTEAAVQASDIAASASAAAAQGGHVVGQVVATMADISQSSKRISDITGVIDGIAFQTNILALNAAVEAARAGEQGRGFAVVATEVRSLAHRSAEAAKEIKALIGASVDRVEAGTQLVNDAGASMNDIVVQTRRVSELIRAISSAAKDQESGIGTVGAAVAQLDGVTQQNAALVEQGAAAAESLRHHATRLNDVVARFTLTEPA